jgi:hypothetical protein
MKGTFRDKKRNSRLREGNEKLPSIGFDKELGEDSRTRDDDSPRRSDTRTIIERNQTYSEWGW